MTDTNRPATSKARGICKYYTTQRGCFNSKSCKFLHVTDPGSDPSGSSPNLLTPYDQSKRCRYFAQGYCKRGDECWFIHETDEVVAPDDDDDDPCSVCFEKPSLYGLLGGCDHIFCIDCIRKWRNPAGKGGDISNIKKCPYCRAECRYIIPSSRYCREGPEKERIVQNYKDSMKRVPCKHFVATKAKDPMCPFGKDCFYQHVNDDGTPYIFSEGVDISMQKWAQRHRTRSFWTEPLFLPSRDTFVENIARDMVDQVMAVVMHSSAEGQGADTSRSTQTLPRLTQSRAARMMADAMSVLRAHFTGGSDYDGEAVRILPGLVPPPNWDLDTEGEGADNGWGWNELVADAVHDADVDFAQRLESLADNMLGSMRIVRGHNTESGSPPPLEPIDRQRADTPPPPLEPMGNRTVDDLDDMPALQSVSNSSDTDYSDTDLSEAGEPFRYSAYTATNEPPPLERASDLATASASPSSLEEMSQAPEASSRFRTVVWEDRRTATGSSVDSILWQPLEPDAALVERTDESLVMPGVSEASTNSQDEPILEPPFVTDGRGRVVWSNKDSTETTPAEGREEQPEDASPSTTTSRLFEWMSGLF